MRVRLLGGAGLPRAAARGLPRRARELEPGHDHDRPRVGRRDLPRAARPRDGGAGDRAREAGRDPADARRADCFEPRGGARRSRHRADRRRPWRDPARGGPRALPFDRARRRHSDAAVGCRPLGRHRLPGAGDRAAGLHPRRHRRRDRLDARGAPGRDPARPRREPGAPGARRGVPARLAGARARGDV